MSDNAWPPQYLVDYATRFQRTLIRLKIAEDFFMTFGYIKKYGK